MGGMRMGGVIVVIVVVGVMVGGGVGHWGEYGGDGSFRQPPMRRGFMCERGRFSLTYVVPTYRICRHVSFFGVCR